MECGKQPGTCAPGNVLHRGSRSVRRPTHPDAGSNRHPRSQMLGMHCRKPEVPPRAPVPWEPNPEGANFVEISSPWLLTLQIPRGGGPHVSQDAVRWAVRQREDRLRCSVTGAEIVRCEMGTDDRTGEVHVTADGRSDGRCDTPPVLCNFVHISFTYFPFRFSSTKDGESRHGRHELSKPAHRRERRGLRLKDRTSARCTSRSRCRAQR